LMRNESAIATTAEQNGNGGNITINSPFVVAIPTENSDIVANADRGSGGQIKIIATGIYGLEFREELTPHSDINASSDFGVDGTVELDTPDVDPNRGLTNLPENLVGSSTLIANSCLARSSGQEDRFVITGAGGLPTRPGDAFTSPFPTGAVRSLPTNRAGSAVAPGSVSLTNPSRPSPSRVAVPINPVSLDSQADHSDASPSSNNSPHPAAFVEATGWVKGPKGEVILTAQAPTITPHSSWSTPPTCHDVVGEFGKPNPSASSGAR
jgi:large exoprotein involved in heme utilization and adhesion